ncbi:hypothetical protein ACFE04_000521 [Oxalis oulophora]
MREKHLVQLDLQIISTKQNLSILNHDVNILKTGIKGINLKVVDLKKKHDVAYESLLQKEHEISQENGLFVSLEKEQDDAFKAPMKDDQLFGDAQQKFEECREKLKNMQRLG